MMFVSGEYAGVLISVLAAEKFDETVSLKAFESEALLCDWYGVRLGRLSPWPELSWLLVLDIPTVDGEFVLLDPVGEMLSCLTFDSCFTFAGNTVGLSGDVIDPFLDFESPKLFFCLNFSSQLELLIFICVSRPPTVAEKNRACFLINSSVNGTPLLCCFLAQFVIVRSMSGSFPFDLLRGDLLPSSWYKYLSFCLKTLETVLPWRC